MSYFRFLAIFLGIPIAVLGVLTWWDGRNGRTLPRRLSHYSPWRVLLAHILMALIYTTPWDNYLVATGVWWYNPQLVTGLTIGWVPIEEYTFFAVQPIFTGLWLLFWLRRLPLPPLPTATSWINHRLRHLTAGVAGGLWLIMLGVLVTGWSPGTYLSLELVWALPPILIQAIFGADIWWHYRRQIAVGLLPTTVYLVLADAVAIRLGTWTIDPQQSLGWLLGGVLPVEEMVFFLITNVLVVLGMTLVLAPESQMRVRSWQERLATVRLGSLGRARRSTSTRS